MPAVYTPDPEFILVILFNLHLALAAGAFIRSRHRGSFLALLERAFDCPKCNTKLRGLGLVSHRQNLYPHLRQSQMPVPTLFTATISHCGQRWTARETFSISMTRLRTNLP